MAVAPAGAAAQRSCSFAEEYNPAGWDIPGLADSKVVRSEGPSSVAGVSGVFADALDLREKRASLLVLYCDPKHPGRLVMRDQPVNVRSITRFRRNQRVFAYRVVADRVEVAGGEWREVGQSETLIYYDVDGSGTFKLRSWATLFTLEVPDWVKSEAGH
jgi:hypothetical protein